VYVVAYVVTLVAFVLVIWIGRRYASMESLEEGTAQDNLRRRLENLDSSWPLVMVAFSGAAISICWMLIPPGT